MDVNKRNKLIDRYGPINNKLLVFSVYTAIKCIYCEEFQQRFSCYILKDHGLLCGRLDGIETQCVKIKIEFNLVI